MSIDLDLVREFMNDEELPANELLITRSILDEAIGSEIGEGNHVVTVDDASQVRNRRAVQRMQWLVGIAAAVAAIAVLIFQVVPPSKVGPSMAAAAQISRLADSVQASPPLQVGQWSTYQLEGVLAANVSSVGKTATPDAKSSIPIALEMWSNSTGTTCTSQQFGTATFASPANTLAWHSIGLIDTPMNQPVTGCAAGRQASLSAGSNLASVDVSRLTHDPVRLATQLQGATTGIPSLDQAARGDSAYVAGFVRLTVLLVGPTNGAWSGFGQEVLRTMALLPRVIGLGQETSHSGRTGMAFSTGQQVTMNPQTGAVISRWSGPTVLLGSKTGELLEARDFAVPLLQAAAQDFVGSPSAPVFTDGVSYGISTEWIDPVSSPGIIGQDALPGWISTFHVVEAVTKPTTTEQQISTTLDPFLGHGNSAFSEDGVPGAGQTTFDITIMGTAADEAAFVAKLTNSGLFASVTIKA